MIKKVMIENFKSIKHVELDCKRVNVFIGEPNSGKSNILEAVIGLPSSVAYEFKLQDAVRFDEPLNLFYDEIADERIKVYFENYKIYVELSHDRERLTVMIFSNNWFEYQIHYYPTKSKKTESWKWGYLEYYDIDRYEETKKWLKSFKFYRFVQKNIFREKSTEFLLPPNGDNLASILAHNRELRKIANNIVSKFGFKLAIKPRENKLEIQRELEEGVIVSFPYTVLSDTLQRIIFYSAAVCTNKDSIIAMEEPEAHAFPYYTKYLAELIAQDKNNQYFITTHNPYFLLSLLEKTPKEEIAVFITYYRNYQTQVKKLSEKEIQEVVNLDIDVFFNLDMFLED